MPKRQWKHKQSFITRFLKKVEKQENGCWIWSGGLNGSGYGMFCHNKLNLHAHQHSYRHFKGEVPEGLELDHTCRNRACVNPDHLEAVSHKTNILRGTGPAAINARKTHCHKGHALTTDNVRMNGGRRVCRTCAGAYQRRYYIKNKKGSKP